MKGVVSEVTVLTRIENVETMSCSLTMSDKSRWVFQFNMQQYSCIRYFSIGIRVRPTYDSRKRELVHDFLFPQMFF